MHAPEKCAAVFGQGHAQNARLLWWSSVVASGADRHHGRNDRRVRDRAGNEIGEAEQDQEADKEQREENHRQAFCKAGNAGEAERSRDQRNDETDDRPAQHIGLRKIILPDQPQARRLVPDGRLQGAG